MTSLERITHDPDWYEPYRISLAVRANGLIFMSGQAGIDESGATVSGGFEAQARRAFANVAKVTIMVTDMSHLDVIIKLRGEYFTEPYPADTLLRVAGLAQSDWLVEIDAVAVAPDATAA